MILIKINTIFFFSYFKKEYRYNIGRYFYKKLRVNYYYAIFYKYFGRNKYWEYLIYNKYNYSLSQKLGRKRQVSLSKYRIKDGKLLKL